MATPSYSTAPQEMVDLLSELIVENQSHLVDVRIGLLVRDEAPKSRGMKIFSGVTKVNQINQALMPYDFVIWVAEDVWSEMSDHQHRATLEHALCYIGVFTNKRGVKKLRTNKPDYADFNLVIARYGYDWRPGSQATVNAINHRKLYNSDTPLLSNGIGKPRVSAVAEEALQQATAILEADATEDDEAAEDADNNG